MLKDVIKQARLQQGLTQEQIAKKVKVAKQTYLKWENGETEPKATQIRLLAENLKITADEICNGELYTKYSLEDFIYERAKATVRGDLETLATWKHVPDHKRFIEDLAVRSEEDQMNARILEEEKEKAYLAAIHSEQD